jgi:HTH-type transcriptional regulator, sugar sensing transcriptional regulator
MGNRKKLSSSDELVHLLQQLGLNLYESKAYLALVARGQISARDLGQLTTIPQSRTYDVLQRLKDRGFAMTTPSSAKTYMPVEPKHTLSALYGEKRKQIQSQMITVQEETEKKMEELQAVLSLALDKISSVTSEQNQVISQPVFVIEGHQNIENAMVRLIDKAEKEFLRITKPPETRKDVLDPFYFTSGRTMGHLETAKKRGVRLRALSLVYEIPSLFGFEIPKDDVVERKYLEKADDIHEKFVLVDNRTALLNLRDPVSKTFGSIGLMLESENACSILKQHFQSMWEKAESRSSVINRMKKATEDLCKAMTETDFSNLDVSVYRTLARDGATEQEILLRDLASKRHHPSEILKSIDKLRRFGLLAKNTVIDRIMVENPVRAKSMVEQQLTEKGKVDS